MYTCSRLWMKVTSRCVAPESGLLHSWTFNFLLLFYAVIAETIQPNVPSSAAMIWMYTFHAMNTRGISVSGKMSVVSKQTRWQLVVHWQTTSLEFLTAMLNKIGCCTVCILGLTTTTTPLYMAHTGRQHTLNVYLLRLLIITIKHFYSQYIWGFTCMHNKNFWKIWILACCNLKVSFKLIHMYLYFCIFNFYTDV